MERSSQKVLEIIFKGPLKVGRVVGTGNCGTGTGTGSALGSEDRRTPRLGVLREGSLKCLVCTTP